MFFASQSATSWLVRGIAWTLAFELLLVAFTPFELALWSTHTGVRISRRFETGRALLEHHSPRRRMGRRAALAAVALTLPFALIAVGVGRQIPSGNAAPPRVTKITRVVRVVRPVKVERVVRVKTVSEQVPGEPVYISPARDQQTPARHVAKRHKTAARKPASTTKPVKTPVTQAPETDTTPSSGTGVGTTPTTTTDPSGAAGSPTT
jgi:hypothetical protein